MASQSFIIFVTDGPWRISATSGGTSIDVPATETGGPENASAAAAALEEAGYQGEPVLLAIPSTWCLSAAIGTEGLPRKHHREAMAYRLEEKLPLAAEDFVADFTQTQDDQCLGVCVRTHRLGPIIEALESRGVVVDHVCPTAFLALQGLMETWDGGANRAEAMTAVNGKPLDVFTLNRGTPTSWSLAVNGNTPLVFALASGSDRNGPMASDEGSAGDRAIDAPAERSGTVQIACEDGIAHKAAAAAGREVLAGQTVPIIDLRRGSLAAGDSHRQVRRSVNTVLAALAIFLVAISGSMLWRAHQYDQLADGRVERQRDLFREAVPTQASPSHPRSRLQSEHRKLSAMAAGSGTLSLGPSALVQLQRILGSLPSDVRYRVLELRVDPDRFAIEGQARSHGDADAIAGSLRSTGGLQVEAPRTDRLDDRGVGFVLQGSVPTEAKAAAGKRGAVSSSQEAGS